MARKAKSESREVKVVEPFVAPTRDPLDMTMREFLAAFMNTRSATPANDPDEWINIRDERYPWRHIVDAAEQGECEVARVGRRLMMQRRELGRWLATRRITGPGIVKAQATTTSNEPKNESELQRQARISLERAGFRRR